MFGTFLARQFGKPSGPIAPLVLAPLWNRRNKALNESALGLLVLGPDDHVLEVGFGGGYLLGRVLAHVTSGFVAGIDASPAMTAHCRRRHRRHTNSGRLTLETALVGTIPYADGHFDKVCSVNSLFYWPDLCQGIHECWRVTRPGGMLVLVFTGRASLKARSFAQHGLVLHDGAEVGEVMRETGFDVGLVEEASDAHRRYWCVVGTKVDRSRSGGLEQESQHGPREQP